MRKKACVFLKIVYHKIYFYNCKKSRKLRLLKAKPSGLECSYSLYTTNFSGDIHISFLNISGKANL